MQSVESVCWRREHGKRPQPCELGFIFFFSKLEMFKKHLHFVHNYWVYIRNSQKLKDKASLWKWKWSRSVVSDSLWPMDCSPPSSSIHGILQARILEWVWSAAYLIHSIQLLPSKPHHPTIKAILWYFPRALQATLSCWLGPENGFSLFQEGHYSLSHLKSYLHSFGFSHDAFNVSSWKIKALHILIFFINSTEYL